LSGLSMSTDILWKLENLAVEKGEENPVGLVNGGENEDFRFVGVHGLVFRTARTSGVMP
jgi:hypothetical protein